MVLRAPHIQMWAFKETIRLSLMAHRRRVLDYDDQNIVSLLSCCQLGLNAKKVLKTGKSTLKPPQDCLRILLPGYLTSMEKKNKIAT